MTVVDPLLGQMIGGYRPVEVISRNDSSTIYRARPGAQAEGEEVALKVYAPNSVDGGIQRLLEEVERTARVSHPNLARILGAGEHQGRLWVASELVAGESLRTLLDGGALPVDEALGIARGVLAGLRAMHGAGAFHRDLSADCVIIQADGAARLVGFGFDRAFRPSPLMGDDTSSLEHLAPEQILGAPIGPGTDLYAAGIIVYEMLTGRRPFSAPLPAALIYQQLNVEAEPPSQVSPRVPESVDRLVMRMLAKLPEHRPATAGQILEDLEAVRRRHDLLSLPTIDAHGEQRQEADRRHRTFEPRFVGRVDESAELTTLAGALEADGGRLVFLAGEAGVGKTRLLDEVSGALAASHLVVRGACRFENVLGAYMPFLDAVGELLSTSSGLREAERAGLADSLVSEMPELGELADGPTTTAKVRASFAAAYGDDDGDDSARLRFFDAIADLLTAAASVRPLILILEDLHWSNAGTQQLLRHLAGRIGEAPILLLASYRPEDGDGSGDAFARLVAELLTEATARRLDLGRLSCTALAELSRSLFQESDLVTDFDDYLFAHSQGNPFVALEILKMLRDQGVLFCASGLWQLRAGFASTVVPERVESLLRRRIEALDAGARELLELAAVMGPQFSIGLLERALGVPRLDLLRRLFRLEREHRLILGRDGEYEFAHSMVREVLYRDLPGELRREYHRQLAILMADGVAGTDASSAELGWHYYEAGEYHAALPHLRTASEEAWRLCSWQDAARLYEQVVSAAEAEPANVDAILHGLLYGGRACAHIVAYDDARQRLGRMRHLAERHGRLLDAAAALHEAGCLALQQGHHERATETFTEATNLLSSIGGDDIRVPYARALTRWGAVDFECGRYEQAEHRWEEARAMLADDGGVELANVLNNLAVLFTMRGEDERALDLYKQVLEQDDEASRSGLAVLTWYNMGMLRADQGRWQEALELYDRSFELCRQSRLTAHEPVIELNRGEAHLGAGDLASARDSLAAALRGFRRIDDSLGAADALKWFGRLCSQERNWDEGAAFLQRSIEINREFGESVSLGEALYEMGELSRLSGSPDSARELLLEAADIFEKAEARPDLERVRSALDELTPA